MANFVSKTNDNFDVGKIGTIAGVEVGAHEVRPYPAKAETAVGLCLSLDAEGKAVIGGAKFVGFSVDQAYITNITTSGNVPANGELAVLCKGDIWVKAPGTVNPTIEVAFVTATGELVIPTGTNASTTTKIAGARYETSAVADAPVRVRLNS